MAGPKPTSKPDSRASSKKVASTPNAKPTSTSKTTGAQAKDKENKSEAKKASVVIHWSKPDNFHLTDSLLTLIEDSVTWRVALGFDKGSSVNPTSTGKGKTLIQHCADIAQAFFLEGSIPFDMEYTKEDLPMLKGVIRNHINSLKSVYSEHRKVLGETGHGLVTTGHAAELHGGSDVANAWELIEEKFPWYLHINELMGGSPVSSRKAISNSQSNLDTSVLGTENEEEIPWPRTPTPVDEGTPSLSPWALSPCENSYGDEGEDDLLCSPKLKLVVPSKRPSESASSQPTKKRKSPQDLLKEVADAERDARLAMNAVNAKQRTMREEIKCKSAHETAVAIERMHIQAQHEQAVADRAHQLLMIEKQIELARIQRGLPDSNSSFAIDPSLR